MTNKQKYYHVYIMASISKALYVGVTGSLYKRVKQHKEKQNPKSFTARYHITKLVYYEMYKDIDEAIKREKQLKKWRREKKVKLIELVNKGWKDLSKESQFGEGKVSF